MTCNHSAVPTAVQAETELEARVRQLLDQQFQGVLATQQDHAPYTSLMAFAATADLRGLLIATLRQSQKHHNLCRNTEVSFLIDNRTNAPEDYQHAVAISANGSVRALTPEQLPQARNQFLARHPSLRGFLDLPDCVLLCIDVRQYQVVSQFQAVAILRMSDAR